MREVNRIRKFQKDQRSAMSVTGPDVEDKDKRSPILSVYLPSNRVRMVNFSHDKDIRIYPNNNGRQRPRNADKNMSLIEKTEE
jgi:hypothetical protein